MKKILFVCIENSCRSQIAQGFARAIGERFIEAYSAGSNPSGKVNPMAVEIMREVGIDLSTHTSKGFNDLPVQSFDYVVTMGCGDVCPFVPGKKQIDWHIDDPKGKDTDFFRGVREQVRENVAQLLQEIQNQKKG